MYPIWLASQRVTFLWDTQWENKIYLVNQAEDDLFSVYWSLSFISIKSFSLYIVHPSFGSFHKATINVTALPYEPYWMESGEGNITKYSGMDYNLLMTLAKVLNFTFRILPSHDWNEVSLYISCSTIIILIIAAWMEFLGLLPCYSILSYT